MDYREDYYKGLAKIYFNSILDKIIEMGNLREEKGVILDYGCGVGHLKRKLSPYNVNVIGYDKFTELSDIDDYKTLTPAIVVCSGVLEHLYESEIERLMRDFIEMNPMAQLLVFLPTENIISKIGMLLTGTTDAHKDHIVPYKQANKVIEKYYKIKRQYYIMFRMAQITRYSVDLKR